MPGTPSPLYQFVIPTVSGDSGTWGTSLNANLNNLDTYLGSPRINLTQPTVGATTTLNFTTGPACTFQFTVSQATTIAFSNVPGAIPAGTACLVVARCIITNGSAFALTWPAAVHWIGTAPTLQAAGVDLIELWTTDGGTNWYAARLTGLGSGVKRHSKATSSVELATAIAGGTTTLNWDTNDASDVGSLHSTGVNPDRMTIPAGWEGGGILLHGAVVIACTTLNELFNTQLYISKNGTGGTAARAIQSQQISPTSATAFVDLAVSYYEPSPSVADYFTLGLNISAGSGTNLFTVKGTISPQNAPHFSAIQLY